MATIFTRDYDHPFWDREALRGPCPDLTLREWEVSVILWSLPRPIRKALLAWLIAPTDHRLWPWPETFQSHRVPFEARELGAAAAQRDLLWEEVKGVRQTLDFPYAVLHGITRDTLLAAHGTRLRQVGRALGWRQTLEEVARMTQPEAGPPAPPAPRRGRWARLKRWFFSRAR